VLFIFAVQVCAEARLFADLTADDIKPRDWGRCQLSSVAGCLSEFQTGRFDGAQNHRSLEFASATAELLSPRRVRLLLLITTIWRNFQRRRLLRLALARCSLLFENSSAQVLWKFLLGTPPPAFMRRAEEEAALTDDLLLLGGVDEINYAHMGDAYELSTSNPELTKIVVALRLLLSTLHFEYLMVVDDDSFVSLPNALELLNLVPSERIYIGNMIDSVPQRWSKGKVRPEYAVNIYLHAPSKVPVFAHGMGFVVSYDVAKLLGDMGLLLKSRGNDDMLLGLWLRSIEHLHYLHYWPWFIDHEDFGGAFTRPCDASAVVVHRMTPKRWQRFSVVECSVCGPPNEPLDEEPEGGPANGLDGLVGAATSGDRPGGFTDDGEDPRSCLHASEVACIWSGGGYETAFRAGSEACIGLCKKEAVINGTRVRCPASLCHGLCLPEGPRNPLCPTPYPGSPKKPPPRLALVIFGSRWENFKMRQLLRKSLRSCSSPRLGVHNVPHVFMMGALPEVHDSLRRSAASEVLHKGDLAVLQMLTAEVQNTSIAGHEGAYFGSGIYARANATYAYASAWRVVEERFGGADYLLMMDHRSFVNVPFIMQILLPRFPLTKMYAGCLVDETFYGHCRGKGETRCDYLWRRRAPLFAHGMGFIVSSDVARFVADMYRHTPLRTADLPADIAFGMWVQPLEDLLYESVHKHFHGWPSFSGQLGGDEQELIFPQPLSEGSALVFPMSPERWRRFDGRTCTLIGVLEQPSEVSYEEQNERYPAASASAPVSASINASNASVAVAAPSSEVERLQREVARLQAELAEARAAACATPPARASEPARLEMQQERPLAADNMSAWPEKAAPIVADDTVDCWKGMGGRPEAWHLVCCEMHWSDCWGGGYTEEMCCQQVPGEGVKGAGEAASAEVTWGLEAFGEFLGFSDRELQLFLTSLNLTANATDADAARAPRRFRCLSPKDCAREAFARFHQQGWAHGFLPLRHPWITDPQDHLFGLALKLRSENDGWGPKGHEHTFERVQLGHWLTTAAGHINPEDVPGERRCLEWDSSQYSRRFFKQHCDYLDVVTYEGEGAARVDPMSNGQRRYIVDVHEAEKVVPADSIGIVVCTQIFEHLRKPHIAMAQLFRAVAPGGFVVWSAPLFSEIHGAPEDFYRYTPMGAQALAEDSGFRMVGQYAPGGLRELSGYLLGMTAPYWKEEDVLHDAGSNWPLQVYMILQKP